ncbi:MAG: helix-turn-helix transcriptional regulator [Lachnospiraceae bacterium]|nr:helix-turn-helix transcriptional regulator [Lachnospiraceae bacterium]
MNSIFTENLKKFRLAKGFTQEQVADTLNVNSQTVSRWECGVSHS